MSQPPTLHYITASPAVSPEGIGTGKSPAVTETAHPEATQDERPRDTGPDS